MKPTPLKTVHEMLAQGAMPAKAILPYDANVSERTSFLTIGLGGELVALPLLALGKASLRGDAATIVLEFSRLIVKIEGRKLEHLFDEILMCKVRVIRVGKHPSCTVECVRITETVAI
jgi:hypothetical protein